MFGWFRKVARNLRIGCVRMARAWRRGHEDDHELKRIDALWGCHKYMYKQKRQFFNVSGENNVQCGDCVQHANVGFKHSATL